VTGEQVLRGFPVPQLSFCPFAKELVETDEGDMSQSNMLTFEFFHSCMFSCGPLSPPGSSRVIPRRLSMDLFGSSFTKYPQR